MPLRRISTKWVLTVLAAVVIPFVGFAWYLDTQTARRQWEVLRFYLLTTANDLAERIDSELRERARDVELKASDSLTVWAVDGLGGDEVPFDRVLAQSFDRFVMTTQVYDLILAVDKDGQLVVSNTVWPDGGEFNEELRASLRLRDYSAEQWFREASEKRVDEPLQTVIIDHHASTLLPARATSGVPHPENHYIGFAAPVRDQLAPEHVVGVVYALMSWSHVQRQVLHLDRPPQSKLGIAADATSYAPYSTSYAWLWMSDADTIIAHPTMSLYMKRVSQPPVNLPQLVTAARSSDSGFYPEYEYGGKLKNAAFKHCAPREKGGLGWIVGVGIDNSDVTSFLEALRSVLIKATLLALVVVLVLTILVARRTTAPIVALREHTRRVAQGDLEARVEVKSRDELGELGRAFNEMTRELAENRSRLVKAEKDAAWREMARQVAHEIKNPLTPISLSATLLKRAKDEKSPEFDSIFERTIELVTRQVEHMRKIASDFSAFAGARSRTIEAVDVGELLDQVLVENAAWAAESRIEVRREGTGGLVLADKSELRRVLINLVSNAIEAMPAGGVLAAKFGREISGAKPWIVLEIQDSGVGLSDTVRARLFEPYFTTRTHGTGLGLAISARLVDEMNGRIELMNRRPEDGPGAIARVHLPEHLDAGADSPVTSKSA